MNEADLHSVHALRTETDENLRRRFSRNNLTRFRSMFVHDSFIDRRDLETFLEVNRVVKNVIIKVWQRRSAF